MKKILLKITVTGMICAIFLLGCSGDSSVTTDNQEATVEETEEEVDNDEIVITDEIAISLSNADLDDSITDEDLTIINLDNENTSFEGDGAEFLDGIVTISSEGTYLLSGTLEDGQVIVNVDKFEKVKLILNGVDITSTKASALYIASADKAIITLVSNTVNTFTDAEIYESEDTGNACIYSSDDLTINGEGTLIVNGNYNNGIGCKNDLTIIDGNYDVTAVNNAIKGNGSVVIIDGTFLIVSEDDGIKSDEEDGTKGYVYIQAGEFNITAGDDGIQAYTAIVVKGGNYVMNIEGKKTNSDNIEDVLDGIM